MIKLSPKRTKVSVPIDLDFEIPEFSMLPKNIELRPKKVKTLQISVYKPKHINNSNEDELF